MNSFELRQIKDTWYLVDKTRGIWGKGASMEEALADMQTGLKARQDFEAQSGMQPFEFLGLEARSRSWFSGIWPTLRLLIVFSLFCIPVSVVLNNAVKLAVDEIEANFHANGIWRQIDEIVLDLGNKKHELSDEQAEKVAQAVQRIQNRYKPVIERLNNLKSDIQ